MKSFWKKQSFSNNIYLREKTNRGCRATNIRIWESWDGDYWLYKDKLVGKFQSLNEAKTNGEKLLTNQTSPSN